MMAADVHPLDTQKFRKQEYSDNQLQIQIFYIMGQETCTKHCTNHEVRLSPSGYPEFDCVPPAENHANKDIEKAKRTFRIKSSRIKLVQNKGYQAQGPTIQNQISFSRTQWSLWYKIVQKMCSLFANFAFRTCPKQFGLFQNGLDLYKHNTIGF